MFEDVDSNEQRAAITRQGIGGDNKGEDGVLSRQTSMPDFFKSSSRTCASPPVLLDTGDGGRDGPTAVQQEALYH